MHKFWTGLARFFAVLFSILFVLTAVGAVAMGNFDRRLLTAMTYKNVLNQQQVYGRLPRVIAEQLVMSMNYNPCSQNPLSCEGTPPAFQDCAKQVLGSDRYSQLIGGLSVPTSDELEKIQPCVDKYGVNATGGAGTQSAGRVPDLMKKISVSDWETVITALFPPETLKSTTDNLIDQVFAFLNGRQETVTIDLSPLKSRLSSQAGVDSLLTLIRAQPACSVDEAVQLLVGLATGQLDGSLCRPPEDVLTQMAPVIRKGLDLAIGQIPDKTVILPAGGSGAISASAAKLTNDMRIAHLVLRVSPVIPLFFLLLISFLAVRNPKSWLRWWGVPILVTGVFSLLLSVAASSSFERVWVNILAGRIPASLSLGAITLGHDVLRALVQAFLAGVAIEGIIFSLIGTGMLVVSAFLKPKPSLPGKTSLPAA